MTDAVDTAALVRDLTARVSGEVRFSEGDRALYATDASNYRQVPIGVVIPRTVDDVVAAIDVCRAHDAPVLSRGGGTSLAGQCCNAAVVIDWSKYLHRVTSIDPSARSARVQPGCVLDDLRGRAAAHGLTFGPDPATHSHCTLGGMVGNNSCGVHSVMAGRTSDNVASLDVLTYDGLRMTVGATSERECDAIIAEGGRRGEIYAALRLLRDTYAEDIRARFPRIPRRVSGFNLDELLPENGFNIARALVGTESTCVTVLEAEVQLIAKPRATTLLVLGYPDVYAAGADVPEVMAAGPCGCEGLDRRLFERTKEKHLHPDALALMPEGDGWLIVEFGADTKEDADAQARELMRRLKIGTSAPTMKLFEDGTEEQKVWEVRESGLGATAHEPGGVNTWPGWEDSAVAPEDVGDYMRDLRSLYSRYGYHGAMYGHFGQGCVHSRIDFDLVTAPGTDRFRAFLDEASDLVLSYGGSLSGEHGDGQARGALLTKMYGDRLVDAFRQFKAIWDPRNRMNPGKVVDAAPVDAHLRLGPDYSPWEPVTFFGYPEDQNSFARAGGLRCVGVGKCRREGEGTMCPSYMVTREEKHSTRGRARLLFEMMQGDVIRDGWRSEAVRDALDLCLACKGCFGDCPVNVDMATYKAEFLAHHYEHRLRPRAHYAMGWLPVVARLAQRAPSLVNGITHAPWLRGAVKRAAGLDAQRDLPDFARATLRSQLARRRAMSGQKRVLLWVDTFTNHFDPHVGLAAVDVLEHAGYDVVVPPPGLCCGLTWISTGQLKTARRVLRRTVEALVPFVRDGVPVVGLEPSCTAVFRHDLAELLPHDLDGQRLREQTVTLAELLIKDGWQPPLMPRHAIVQGHCHHRAVMEMGADEKLLARAGIDADLLDSGCCGLAGNFGFEQGHYEVSIACAERVLAPAVRAASDETIVMADGFSCRTQIDDTTDRRALHLAQVLAMAIHQGEPDASTRFGTAAS